MDGMGERASVGPPVKRIAILQSSYIPWRGYFAQIDRVDEFVLFDIVQFTKRDWRNRNRIKTATGLHWLTIPVVTAGAYHQTIADTRIDEHTWAAKHWRSIQHAYSRAPHYRDFADGLAALFERCAGLDSLSAVNRVCLETVCGWLGITTPITDAVDDGVEHDRNGRLIAICQERRATHYLSGPSAGSYLDLQRFADAGITVELMDYSSFTPYPQLHGAFEPSVSILDVLLNVGPAARQQVSPLSRLEGVR